MEFNVIFNEDCLQGLRKLPDGCVHTCVTSPPYYGLRDYQTAKWEGGDPGCDHKGASMQSRKSTLKGNGHGGSKELSPYLQEQAVPFRGSCPKCGAVRVDRQIGLEETPDAYVARLVEVFREVRRVLRDDGTLWLNLGDSYNAAGRIGHGTRIGYKQGSNRASATGSDHSRPSVANLKPKDLIGIPWRVAFALQADGWYLRQDIIWHKPNPMPESVTDRCTKAHEYIFLLAKSDRYYYDAEAVKEESKGVWNSAKGFNLVGQSARNIEGRIGDRENLEQVGRNRRSVWTVTTKPYAEAHFATFPPDLIEPCILAGSPSQSCPKCGAPYERVVEKETSFEGGSGRAGRTAEEVNASGKHRNGGGAGNKNLKLGPTVRSNTVDFQPTCECGLTETVPGLVLDPFMGSGTTAAVAVKLGRRYVGTELNPEYVKLAKARIREAGMQPLLFV